MSAPINARAMLADRTLIDHAPLYVRWLCERVIELEEELERVKIERQASLPNLSDGNDLRGHPTRQRDTSERRDALVLSDMRGLLG